MELELFSGLFIVIAGLSFFCEYMDASIGMGYGTTLTPLLLIVGFDPLDVVPAVLLGQIVGGIVGGYFHHKMGNIYLDFRQDRELKKENGFRFGYIPRSIDAKVVLVLVVSGILGGIIGVISAINIPGGVLRAYIGLMLVAIGTFILIRLNHTLSFSFRALIGVAFLSAFNKGISGGGYGPLVTGGQVLIGRKVKNSIGSTTVAEVGVCLISFLSYLILKGGLYWPLVSAVFIGSVLAGPLSALTVKKVNDKGLKLLVGLVIAFLGTWTLAGLFFPQLRFQNLRP